MIGSESNNTKIGTKINEVFNLSASDDSLRQRSATGKLSYKLTNTITYIILYEFVLYE